MLEAGGVVELLAGVAEDEVDGCVGFGNQFAKAVVGAMVGNGCGRSRFVVVGDVANRA